MRQEQRDIDDFAKHAAGKQAGLLSEVAEYLRITRKWWLAPIILILLLVGIVVVLGGTAVAPLIYTLF